MQLDCHQLNGAAAIAEALESNDVRVELLLVVKGHSDATVDAVIQRARDLGVPVRLESANDFRRMGRAGQSDTVLALVGRSPRANLGELMRGPGLLWLLSNVSYPANAGVAIRTAEVAGAAGVVIDGPFTRKMRKLALRVAMRADRFMPVLWEATDTVLSAAKSAGRVLIALEHGAKTAPWQIDLTGRILIIAGGERDGLDSKTIAACDHTITLPTPGFIPSYNVQAAVSAVAIERLRQLQR